MPNKILVADDEPDILNLAKKILEKNGFQVVTASNGEEALQKTEAEMPDLVLLDVVMPAKSGVDVCRILKSQTKTKHIPVVLFTVLSATFDRSIDMRLANKAGADGHFAKPFTSENLLAAVKRHLSQTREVSGR